MRCPICKKPVEEPTPGGDKTAYPFCSERCRVIDLGRWLDEKYQIPVTEKDDEDPDEGTDDPSSK